MKRMLFMNMGAALLLLLALTLFTPMQMHATVILEGSDAIGFHCALGSSGACIYRDEVWSAIGGVDPRKIAVIGTDVTGTNSTASGTHAVADFATVADAVAAGGSAGLNDYVAVYFLAGSGCCSEDDSLITASGAQASVSSYLTGGGTVMIENYTGGAAWDFAVGTSGGANGAVSGVGGGFPIEGSSCDDGETVTPLGLTNGFVQPPALGCWEHQAYEESVFAPLGFTKSFFDASPAFTGTSTGWSGLLSNGSTVVGASAVPEPSSIAVLSGLMLLGIGAIRRRRAS